MSLIVPDFGEIELLEIGLGNENGPLSDEEKRAAYREVTRKTIGTLRAICIKPVARKAVQKERRWLRRHLKRLRSR